jgi:transposase
MLLLDVYFPTPYMETSLMVAQTTLNHRWCVGIDLHKDTLTACTYCGCCGEISWRKIACQNRQQIIDFFRGLPQPHTVALESVGFYRWLWELAEPCVEKLVLADATGARALAGRRLKTDREDAANVAELLAANKLPLAWAPTMEVQILRDLARHRNVCSRQHARILHRVRSLMNTNNRPGPKQLNSDSLIRYLRGQGEKLPERHVAMLWSCVDQLTLTERQIDQAERDLAPLLASETFRETRRILDSFPGVAMVAAATILGEVGDFTRFADRKAIARYAGLNPRVFSSADKHRIGGIAKAGSRNRRWMLQQAAWTAIRCDDRVKRIFHRIAKRSGRKAAATAIARKLLVWMHRAVLRGQTYGAHETKSTT